MFVKKGAVQRIITFAILFLACSAVGESAADRLGKLYASIAKESREFYRTNDTEVTSALLTERFMPVKKRQEIGRRLLALQKAYKGNAEIVIDESKPARIDVRIVIMDVGFCEIGHIAVFRFSNDELHEVGAITTAQTQPAR